MAPVLPAAYFGSQTEKDRWLEEFRAALSAMALRGDVLCPLAAFAREGMWSGPLPYPDAVAAPWMPSHLHTVIHELYGNDHGAELDILESIEPGADLTMVSSMWRKADLTIDSGTVASVAIGIVPNYEHVQQTKRSRFRALLLVAPLRRVPG